MAKAAEKQLHALSEGDQAPDFSMPTDGNGHCALSDFAGKQNVVLYFYPKDDTPGCTVEAKEFGELNGAFTAADTVVIGISKDDAKSHDKFKEKFCLPFTLACDNSDICERYGVWVEKNMYGKKYMGIQRATFLIDKQGKIARIWPKVKIEGHASEVLEEAKELA